MAEQKCLQHSKYASATQLIQTWENIDTSDAGNMHELSKRGNIE
jgi:hypothetical protein